MFGSRVPRNVSIGHNVVPKRQHGGVTVGRLRQMIRVFRRSFMQRSRHTTGDQEVIDVDPALLAAMQAVDDRDTEWEDVDHLGKIQIMV